jgi:hypothetical protein
MTLDFRAFIVAGVGAAFVGIVVLANMSPSVGVAMQSVELSVLDMTAKLLRGTAKTVRNVAGVPALPDMTAKALRWNQEYKSSLQEYRNEVLVAVENRTDRTYTATGWSCVMFSRNEPVYESLAVVDQVQPNQRTIGTLIFYNKDKFDAIECRLTVVQP